MNPPEGLTIFLSHQFIKFSHWIDRLFKYHRDFEPLIQFNLIYFIQSTDLTQSAWQVKMHEMKVIKQRRNPTPWKTDNLVLKIANW